MKSETVKPMPSSPPRFRPEHDVAPAIPRARRAQPDGDRPCDPCARRVAELATAEVDAGVGEREERDGDEAGDVVQTVLEVLNELAATPSPIPVSSPSATSATWHAKTRQRA